MAVDLFVCRKSDRAGTLKAPSEEGAFILSYLSFYGQLRTPSAQRQPPQAGWVLPMQSS